MIIGMNEKEKHQIKENFLVFIVLNLNMAQNYLLIHLDKMNLLSK